MKEIRMVQQSLTLPGSVQKVLYGWKRTFWQFREARKEASEISAGGPPGLHRGLVLSGLPLRSEPVGFLIRQSALGQ
jgi:hypothetical protein